MLSISSRKMTNSVLGHDSIFNLKFSHANSFPIVANSMLAGRSLWYEHFLLFAVVSCHDI